MHKSLDEFEFQPDRITDYSVNCPLAFENQRTNGPVNAHLISWPSKAQNIQNLENIW